MFQSGSQINPALGRTDYSAYTQGAAQGAQAIGQGMQQLGQGIGAAVKEYKINKEKKEQEKAATATIKSYLIKNPGAAEALGIDPLDDGAVKAASKNYGGPAGLVSLVNQQEEMNFRKQQRAQQDADSIAAANAQGLNQSYNFGPNGVPNFGGEAINTTPPQIPPAVARSMLAAQAARQQQQKFDADISYTKSQTDKSKEKKPYQLFGSVRDIEASYPSEQWDYKMNKTADGFAVSDISPRGKTPETIELPEAAARKAGLVKNEELSAAFIGDWTSKLPALAEQRDQISLGRTLAKDKNTFFGIDSGAKTLAAKAVNAVFPGSFDTSKNELMAVNFADMAVSAASRMAKQGQITEGERKLLSETIPSAKNSQDAYGQLLDIKQMITDRAYAMDEIRTNMEASDAPPSKVRSAMLKYMADNPIKQDKDSGAYYTGKDKPVAISLEEKYGIPPKK